MRHMRKILLSLGLAAALLVVASLLGCGGGTPTPAKPTLPAGSIKINPHPTSLDGKTVVLRWNSKPNGDVYLKYLAAQLAAKVPSAKIIKLWETDKDTAVISDSDDVSDQVTAKIANLKPDLVIAAQAD
jgi:hypothetical protein